MSGRAGVLRTSSSLPPFLSGESRGSECEEGIRITLNRRLAPPPIPSSPYNIFLDDANHIIRLIHAESVPCDFPLCCVTYLLLNFKACSPPQPSLLLPSSPVSPPHADIGKWPFNSSRIAETVTNDPQQHQIKSRVTKGTALSLQQPHLPWETERRKIPMHPWTDINCHRTD